MSSATPAWRKSSRSSTQGGDCVEVARVGGNIGVRDSKDVGGPVVVLSQEHFTGFVEAVKAQG